MPVPFLGYETLKAGGDQASAQQNIATTQWNNANAERSQALGFAAPSVSELAQQQQQFQLLDQQMQRQSAILSSIDPTIMEAGKQALALMRGQQAQTIGPLQQQRDLQRQQLVQNLETEMGPGAARSTAGIQALNQFDAQTASLVSNAQQQAIQNLTGESVNLLNSTTASQGATSSMNLQTLQSLAAVQDRQISASINTSLNKYAGAPFVGDLSNAKSHGQFYGSLFNAGIGGMATAAGAALGAPGAGSGIQGGMQSGTNSTFSQTGSADLSSGETSSLSNNLSQLNGQQTQIGQQRQDATNPLL